MVVMSPVSEVRMIDTPAWVDIVSGSDVNVSCRIDVANGSRLGVFKRDPKRNWHIVTGPSVCNS